MLSFEALERAYQDALSKARGLPRPRVGDDTLIASGLDSLPAARILYTACLHAGIRCTLAEPTFLAMSLIPYRETGGIVLFARDPRSLRVVALSEAAGILGLDVVVVGPEMHPAVEERLEASGVERITVPEPSLLVMSIAAALWSPRMMGAREPRLRRELEELPTALGWVRDSVVRGAAEGLGERIARPPMYTPVAAPGAFYHCLALSCGLPIPLEAARLLGGLSGGLVYASSIEIQVYKDLLMGPRAPARGSRVLLINSDPVTAGLYSVLAAMIITGRVV